MGQGDRRLGTSLAVELPDLWETGSLPLRTPAKHFFPCRLAEKLGF